MAGKSPVVMLAIVGGAVLATAAVAAYPAAVWLGNKMYDQNVENFTKGYPVVYKETEKSFASRKGTWEVNTPAGDFVFRTETTFGITGGESVITPDYESSGFKSVFEDLSIKEYPKAEMHMGYSIAKQAFTSDGFVEPFKIANDDFSCNVSGMKFESTVDQNVNMNATGEEIVKSFRKGSGKSSGNVVIEGLSCAAGADSKGELKIENVKINVESVQSYPSLYNIRIGSLLFNVKGKYELKDFELDQNIDFDSNGFSFKTAGSVAVATFPNEIAGGSVTLNNTGIDVRVEDINDRDFASLIDFYKDVALGEFADKTSDADLMNSPLAKIPLNIKLVKLVSQSGNDGSFKADGSASFSVSNIMNAKAALNLNFSKPYADAIGLGDAVGSGIAMGFLKQDGQNYVSNLSLENQSLTVNGKKIF